MFSPLNKRLSELLQVSREISGDKPLPELFQGVIRIICESTGADGGTLYMHDSKQNVLKAVLLTNRSLGIEEVVPEFDPLVVEGLLEVPLSAEAGADKISAAAFLRRELIAVPDVASNDAFDFSGVHAFDRQHSYKTARIIAAPMYASHASVGVLQIINPSPECFVPDHLEFLEALAGQVATALHNAVLIREGENLLLALVRMVGMAIDEKSPHTAGHCQRVTELTMMLARAAADEKEGPLAAFAMDDVGFEELRMAALLHDVGKVITPNHILEKRTKLHSLGDRMEILRERLSRWRAETELEALKNAVRDAGHTCLLDAARTPPSAEDEEFLDSVNRGLSAMDADNIEKLRKISARTVCNGSKGGESIIPHRDMADLQTFRGTLNPEERKIMEDHAKSTIRLLSSIPWPRKYWRLVEYAGRHHEKMDGTGYPNRVGAEHLSVPARILGLADRFEGMSAPDRPYRSRKMKMSQVLSIMEKMSKGGEIDPDLYALFIKNKIHISYARKYLDDSLIDCD